MVTVPGMLVWRGENIECWFVTSNTPPRTTYARTNYLSHTRVREGRVGEPIPLKIEKLVVGLPRLDVRLL